MLKRDALHNYEHPHASSTSDKFQIQNRIRSE